MATIFISYNRRSEEVTKMLVGDLEKLGHTVWFDQDLTGGQAWWDHILERVRGCDVFVFVLDEKSLSSTACKREYGYAADLGKPILPILVTGDISANLLPPALSRTQFVDYRGQDRDAVLRLARAVASMPPSRPLPDPLPAPPEVPISYLGQVGQQIESGTALTYESQSAMVVDLRRSLRDPESAKDARTLLERLRKRRDLFATIAEEIDELLGIRRTGGSKRPSGPAPGPSETAPPPGHDLHGAAAPPLPKPQPVPVEPDRPADTTPERAPLAGPVLRLPSPERQPGADRPRPEPKPARADEIIAPGTTPPANRLRSSLLAALGGSAFTAVASFLIFANDSRFGPGRGTSVGQVVLAYAAGAAVLWALVGAIAAGVPRAMRWAVVAAALVSISWIPIFGTYQDVVATGVAMGAPITAILVATACRLRARSRSGPGESRESGAGASPVAGRQAPGPDPSMTRNARWKASAVGAGVGVLAGALAIQSWRSSIPVAWVLLPGAAGALAGLLVGTHRRGMITVSVGAVSAWVLGYLGAVASGDSREATVVGGLLGAPAGAVLGAIVELLRRWRERSARPR